MNTKSTITKLFLSASVIVLFGTTSQANAATSCKGLEDQTCNASTSCSWVESYQRKDGRTVKSFCRTKSTAKKAAKTDSQATTSAANTVAKKVKQ